MKQASSKAFLLGAFARFCTNRILWSGGLELLEVHEINFGD